jgi:hypothetical protein
MSHRRQLASLQRQVLHQRLNILLLLVVVQEIHMVVVVLAVTAHL